MRALARLATRLGALALQEPHRPRNLPPATLPARFFSSAHSDHSNAHAHADHDAQHNEHAKKLGLPPKFKKPKPASPAPDRCETQPATPFEFTPENLKKIEQLMKNYPDNWKRAALIPMLDIAQRQAGGWLPLSAMTAVAKIVGVPPVRVYEVATFYTMFFREPIGKYNIQVCTTTSCQIMGAYDILKACEDHLGIQAGQNTPDMQFHLMEVECLGACVNAPMVQINDDFYEDLTPESMKKVIDSFKAGDPLRCGPQVDRLGCMGPQGKTTLFEEPSGPFCRDIDAVTQPASA